MVQHTTATRQSAGSGEVPETDWRTIAAKLRKDITGPTVAQVEFAGRVGLALSPDTPRPVAATLLLRHLATSLGLTASGEPAQWQLEHLRELAEETASPDPINVVDENIADAWIQALHERRVADSLENLRPEPGDVVVGRQPGKENLREVESITAEGELNFRGRPDESTWPYNVRMFARKSDVGYRQASYLVQQLIGDAAARAELSGIGRAAELAQWRVSRMPGLDSFLDLEEALNSAVDERPLQKALEKHPEILANLATGNSGIYVIPQVMLGNQYVPDFLMAVETSAGLQWTLVELESPTASLTLADGQQSKQLRKAIKQITDWREWLNDNSDYARRARWDNGLGLPGIRADAPSLIIISRSIRSRSPDAMRIRERSERNIEIRTYDWLLRASKFIRSRLMSGILDHEAGIVIHQFIEDEP